MENNIARFNPNIKDGLSNEQVNERIKLNLLNIDTSIPTKSIKQIIFKNFFTLFNFINLFLGLAVFFVGSYKNLLFLIIIVLNTAISTYQEIHSKKIIDKLSILSSSKSTVIRNGKKEEISINNIVLDDIILFKSGNQVVTDSIIKDGTVEVNESFITGESDTITKENGDMLLSGSFIVSGTCTAQVEHIGTKNYVSKISSEAKYVKKINSEIMLSLQKIIKTLSFLIVPIGILLFINQYNLNSNLQTAVVSTVAAIIGMIPEGLVLLTSTVLALSVIKLSKNNVLVQELYCIETLARVDTLCLDKTGTLTEGTMEVKKVINKNIDMHDFENILSNFANISTDNNPTILAIKDKFSNNSCEHTLDNPNYSNTKCTKNFIPFSSSKKWSAIISNNNSYIIGAPEFVLQENFNLYKDEIEKYSNDYRVLVVAFSNSNLENNELPEHVDLLGYILISDKIRKEAKDTLKYFASNNVDIKIISGDNPITVSKIAKEVGLKNYSSYIDVSTLKTFNEIKLAVSKYTIFGRVSPSQKKQIILALKEKGKTVAMTGDGVNDVLALKEADCSIAMANGSDATKSVSQLVLLDSNFATMPKVVSEGRRTINNIQRSASLFLVKTIYSTLLSIFFLFSKGAYPFIPIQLTLISAATIGIPSFILALEPNTEKIKGKFLKNIFKNAVPTAITVVINILTIYFLNKCGSISDNIYSSLCVFSTAFCGIVLLFKLSKTNKNDTIKLPFSPFRLCLAFAMLLIIIFGLEIFKNLFSFVGFDKISIQIVRIMILSITNFTVLNLLIP